MCAGGHSGPKGFTLKNCGGLLIRCKILPVLRMRRSSLRTDIRKHRRWIGAVSLSFKVVDCQTIVRARNKRIQKLSFSSLYLIPSICHLPSAAILASSIQYQTSNHTIPTPCTHTHTHQHHNPSDKIQSGSDKRFHVARALRGIPHNHRNMTTGWQPMIVQHY